MVVRCVKYFNSCCFSDLICKMWAYRIQQHYSGKNSVVFQIHFTHVNGVRHDKNRNLKHYDNVIFVVFQIRHKWCELVVKNRSQQHYIDVKSFLINHQVNSQLDVNTQLFKLFCRSDIILFISPCIQVHHLFETSNTVWTYIQYATWMHIFCHIIYKVIMFSYVLHQFFLDAVVCFFCYCF